MNININNHNTSLFTLKDCFHTNYLRKLPLTKTGKFDLFQNKMKKISWVKILSTGNVINIIL